MHDAAAKKTGRAGRILADLFLLLVLAFTVNLAVVRLHRIRTVVLADDYRKVFAYELVLCAVLLLFALDLRFGLFSWQRLRPLGLAARGLIVLLSAGVLFFLGRAAAGGLIDSAGPARHAIVLGMALEDGAPTKDLLSRLDTAERYLAEYPDATLILTGGNADESGKTEAEMMRELLLARGVPEEKLLLEDRAATTKENFRNVAAMIDPAEPTVLISSGYHMERAVRTAEKAGFTAILRCPAPSDLRSFCASLTSEVVLTLNDLAKG